MALDDPFVGCGDPNEFWGYDFTADMFSFVDTNRAHLGDGLMSSPGLTDNSSLASQSPPTPNPAALPYVHQPHETDPFAVCSPCIDLS